MRSIEVEIGAMARESRVLVDGQDISGVVQRVVIVSDVGNSELTKVYLSCVKANGKPFTIKGRLLPETGVIGG